MEDSNPEDMSNSNSSYIPYHLRPETYIVPVLFGLIFVVGVVGNGCLMVIFCKYKAMRSVPNTFIFNLAVGDLIVLLVSVPFTSTVYTLDSWPYGSLVCKFSEFAKDTSVGVSVFTLTALSADRYLAIVDPVRKLVGGPKSKLMLVSLAFIWLLAIALATPAAIFSHVRSFQLQTNDTNQLAEQQEILVCYPFPAELGTTYPKLIVLTKALTHYAVPLLVIGSLYAKMARHLLQSATSIPGQATLAQQHHRHQANGQPEYQHQGRARRKVAKMVLSFVVLFAACFFPSHVFLLWFYFNPNSYLDYNSFWHVLRILGFCLAFINSCINPIALYCISGSFRKHFNRLLCCCCGNDTRWRENSLSHCSRRYTHHSNHTHQSRRSHFTAVDASQSIGNSRRLCEEVPLTDLNHQRPDKSARF